jgi:hypothetical protein
MNDKVYDDFLSSDDTLRVYAEGALVYSSQRERLLALLEYIEGTDDNPPDTTIMDKVSGNAAALLSIKAGSREVYSPLGSRLAVESLEKYGVKHRFGTVVPYILRADRSDMCPMEKLSQGKNPDEFYEALKTSAP